MIRLFTGKQCRHRTLPTKLWYFRRGIRSNVWDQRQSAFYVDKVCCWISKTDQRYLMKRKFKQWWSTIPPISTKPTIISPLHLLNTKKDHDIWRSKFRSWLGTGTQNVAGLNWIMESQFSPLNDWISNCNVQTNDINLHTFSSYYILMLSFNAKSQIKKYGYFSFNLSSFLHSDDKTAISLITIQCNVDLTIPRHILESRVIKYVFSNLIYLICWGYIRMYWIWK